MSHAGHFTPIPTTESAVSASLDPVASPTVRPTLLQRIQRSLAIVRRIIGVPDYAVYLSHMQRHHPACTPMDERTFERERLIDKYSRPGSRCC